MRNLNGSEIVGTLVLLPSGSDVKTDNNRVRGS